ncbi:MAG: hypothetical protein ACE5E6_11125 [Phycisphaerae bacterium]
MQDPTALLDECCGVLERLGLCIRLERLGGGGGGICAVKQRQMMFIDLDADPATRLATCVTALASLDDIDAVYISSRLRELLDQSRAAARGVPPEPRT